ncbi:hypothetical protein BYT27DRAFT_7250747 [Phlegmacium glaucopus]|nr:hypothetical protein BYT27DRAFT_7250747 [Phlegmacium glaucopus]
MSAINWNVPPPTYDDHSMTTTLTPYLQLSHLLSLSWLAYPILSLVFVAFRLQLSLAGAQSGIATAKNDLLASCKAAEQSATAAASMPRFMALATNKQFADAVNGSMDAARVALVLALTAMEAIINFIVDIYRSTFLCFLELVVRGGLSIVISAVQELNNVLQGVADSLRTNIQNDISNANSVITTAINAINKVNPFGDITAPQITVPSLDSLQNLTLPASFQQALTNLNASIPSVAAIKNTVENFIDTPFELLKKDINDTFTGLSFDHSLLPIPDLNRLSFCNKLNTSVVDDIGRDLVKTAKIGVLILIVLALLLIGLNCLLIWYKWRCMKRHLEYTRQAWTSDPTLVNTMSSPSAPQITLSDHNLMMLQANSEHPLVTKIVNLFATRTGLSPSQHINMRWFFHYVFHPPALACFLIGFFGLLSVEVQLLALGPLVATSESRAASAVSDFSNIIANSINQTMYNQSSFYANSINSKVDAVQTTINDGVFGWVNGSTTTLNTTINDFYTEVQNLVATVFNGTILETPANDFLQCFIGSKVDAIENALTFLHNNLNINIPRVRPDVLVISSQSVNEATAPIAAAAIGGGANDNQGIVGRLVTTYEQALKKERVMFAIFMGLWGVVVLMAIFVILWHSYGKPYMQRKGRRRWERERKSGLIAIDQIRDSKYPGEEKREFRSFTPLPSPKGSAFKPFWASRSNSPNTDSPSSSVESVIHTDFVRTRENTSPQHTTPSPPQKKSAKLLAIGRKAMGREQLKKDGEDEDAAPPVITKPSMEELHRNTPWYTKMTALVTRQENQENRVQRTDFNPSAMIRKEREPPKLQVYTERGSLADHDPLSPHHQQEDEHLTRSRWSASPDATQTSWMRIMSPTKKPSALPTVVSPPPVMIVSAPDSPHKPIIGVPIRPKTRQNADIPLDVGPIYEDPAIRRFTPTVTMNPVLPMPLYNGFDRSQMQTRPLSIRRVFPPPPRHPHPHFRRNQESPPPPPKSPHMFEPQNSLAPPPDHHRRLPSTRDTTQQWRITNGTSSDHSSASSDIHETEPSVTPMTRSLTTTHARHSSVVNPFITPFDDEHKVTIETGPADMRKSMQTSPFGVAL